MNIIFVQMERVSSVRMEHFIDLVASYCKSGERVTLE